MGLKDSYLGIEDKWFKFLDKLDSKVPVYKIVDPIEHLGIPSFPFFIALFLLIIIGGFFLLTGGVGFAGSEIQLIDSATDQIIGPGASFYT